MSISISAKSNQHLIIILIFVCYSGRRFEAIGSKWFLPRHLLVVSPLVVRIHHGMRNVITPVRVMRPKVRRIFD